MTEVKKGNKSWRPAQMLDTIKPPSGYRLRWANKDPANLQKKREEGWVMASDLTGLEGDHNHPGGINDGTPISSIKEYRELVLMALPEEDAKARDEYYAAKTRQQTAGLKRSLERDNAAAAHGRAAPIHGKIVIE